MMKVREIMTANPACCAPDTSLQEVARMMEQNDCGLIPVVESHTNMKPIGTITDRDIAIRSVAANQDPTKMKASEIMTTNIATITPETNLEECFRVMEEREIRRVLVVDQQGRCCGIVAQADLVQSPANPIRTNEVIREISESSPSRNQPSGWMRSGDYGSGSGFSSFMSGGNLLPLLVGMGGGIALSYFMNNKRTDSRHQYRSMNQPQFRHENRMDLTNREGFSGYTDAERHVGTEQRDRSGRTANSPMETNFTGSSSMRQDTSTSFREENEDRPKDRGRSAGQGR